MDEVDASFRNAGRSLGAVILRLKPVVQYVFCLLRITYEFYDCVSDGMNVYQYSRGDSLDVSSRNESVYRAFFFSLIVSVVCALISSVGYILIIVGLSKSFRSHRTEKHNTTKLGQLIVFVCLFCQVCFEDSIQSIVLYYYIVRCSVVYSFWKVSLFVCITLSLFVAGYTFFKGAYVWFRKRDSLPRKYPSCFSPCYDSEPSLDCCVALCIFGTTLALGLFALNITTLADIIQHSEVDVPHVLAVNERGQMQSVEISTVKDLVKSNRTLVKEIPCNPQSKGGSSHFLGDQESFNCSSVVFTLIFTKESKKLEYRVNYCYNKGQICYPVRNTNITVKFSHDLCSGKSPIHGFVGISKQFNKTTPTTLNTTRLGS